MISVTEVQTITTIAKDVQNISKDPSILAKVDALLKSEKDVSEQVSKLLKQAQDTQAYINAVQLGRKPEPISTPTQPMAQPELAPKH